MQDIQTRRIAGQVLSPIEVIRAVFLLRGPEIAFGDDASGPERKNEALSQNPIVRLLDKPKSMALPSCVRPFDAHHSSPAHLEF